MSPALEILADHLSRLESDELKSVLQRALELVKERNWRCADDLYYALKDIKGPWDDQT